MRIKQGGKEMPKKTIFLYSNGKDEDIEAYQLLKKANIPFKNFGPTNDEQTPYIEFGYWKYIGLNEITQFVNNYVNNYKNSSKTR